MRRVFLALSLSPDKLLGHVKEDGKLFRSQAGLDQKIGHVNLTALLGASFFRRSV